MMGWRLLGGAFLVLAGWMIGNRASGRFDLHLEALRSFQGALLRIISGIRRSEELPEILMNMNRMIPGEAGAVLSQAGRQIGCGKEPDEAFWKSSLEKTEGLDEEDLRRLSIWFGQLGAGEKSLKEEQLSQIQDYLAEKGKRVQEEKTGCARLYRNLGVLLGLAAAIMLI